MHDQLQTAALEFTELRKNQHELCLNKDYGCKHTWLVLIFSEPAWLAGVCVQLKITILMYLYQRYVFISKRERKNLACKARWRLLRSQRSGGKCVVLSPEVRAPAPITSLTWPICWTVSSLGCSYYFCFILPGCQSHIASTPWGDTALRSLSSSVPTSQRIFWGP